LITRAQADSDVTRWLTAVGLDAAAAQRFPHQFSGGQR
jgi:peptide/nickel transport system ATP-binding protein